ncbi:hypothetical protein AB0F11_35965 [Streptomyces sp. NPDC032472]|uniref:hypothetical protein n=1 Tax=Streptomyces sp. NPDC032472 TaxID=3155018 RepID=UPI0033D59DF2
MTVDAYALAGRIRRRLLRPARPAPAGPLVRLAAAVTVAAMLVYAVSKVYMALRGEVGMPGSPAPTSVQARFAHPAAAQAANALLGAAAGAAAWATVSRRGARLPRWTVLCAAVPACAMAALGAAVTLVGPQSGLGRSGWGVVIDAVWGGVQVAAWLVLVVSYAVRTGRRPAGGSARPTGWAAAAAWGAFACALAYGAMKFAWALGSSFLMRQTPLPRAALDELLEGSSGAVTGHWVSVAPAVVGMAAALHLSDRFGPHGRFRRGLLLVGSWTVCVFMLARAVGVLGYGFAGDLRVLYDPAGVPAEFADLASYQARWDLALWAPYWMLSGVCWGVAAFCYRRRAPGAPARDRSAPLIRSRSVISESSQDAAA